MALKDLYKEYETQTEIFSTICRQLGFAAGAIIWVFKEKDDIFLPFLVLLSLFSLLIYFTCDILQYKIAIDKIKMTFTNCHNEYKTKGIEIIPELRCDRKEENLYWPKKLNNIKVYFLIATYALLIIYYSIEIIFRLTCHR